MYKQIDNKKLTPRLNIPGKFCVEKKSKKKGFRKPKCFKNKKTFTSLCIVSVSMVRHNFRK